MKPAVFDYAAPASVPEALALLVSSDREPKVLAGGQSLIPLLNMRMARPELVVDIGRIDELSELRVDQQGWLRVGAAVTQARVERDRDVRAGWPLLTETIGWIGHPQIRHRGTVGGSMAHHDPAAELPASAVALDARFVVAGSRGRRTVPAAEFFVSTFVTALEPDELLVEILFPPGPHAGWSFVELARRHGDFATIGVAVALTRRDETIADARVVFCGAGSAPVRVAAAERELIGQVPTLGVRHAAGEQVRLHLQPPSDVHASAEYRRHAAQVIMERAIDCAWRRCA